MDEQTQHTQTEARPDGMEADLRALAQAADAGQDTSEQISKLDAQLAGDDGKGTPAKSGGEKADGAERANDKTSKTDPKPGTETPSDQKHKTEPAAKPDEKKTGDEKKPEDSAYRKAQAERQRREKTWKELEMERNAIRAEREQLEAAKREAAAKAEAAQKPKDPLAEFSPEELERHAKAFERDGQYELADKARAAAAAKREAARQAPAGESAPAAATAANGSPINRETFLADWKRNLAEVTAENPELKQQDSPLYKETAALIAEVPMLSRMADGVKHAVQIAKLRIEAGSVPGLKEKIGKLEAEIQTLRQATSLGGSSPENRGGPKDITQMSAAEAERELLALAQAADAAA